MKVQITSYSATMVFEGNKASFSVALLDLDGNSVGSLTYIHSSGYESYAAVCNRPKD